MEKKKSEQNYIYHKSGDENYIKLYQIKLLAGRNIKNSDTTYGMLINSTYAHVLGFANVSDVLGKTIEFGKGKRVIVGVIGDFYQSSLHDAIKPMGIWPQNQNVRKAPYILPFTHKPQAVMNGKAHWQTWANHGM